MNSTSIAFTGSLGSELSAQLDEPERGVRTYALFAHCFTCSKDIAAATRISQGLSRRSIGVLRFDFTGLGQSDGAFENTTLSSNVGDLVAAAAWLGENRAAPKLLVGHSLGGLAVLAAAPQVLDSTAVAIIGEPADPQHVLDLLGPAVAHIEEKACAEVSIGGRPFTIGRRLIDDLHRHDLAQVVASLERAALIFHSPSDDVVGIEHSARLFGWARHPKSFVSLDTADHLVKRAEDAAFIADVLAAWATRFTGSTTGRR